MTKMRLLALFLFCCPLAVSAQGTNLAFGAIKQDPSLPVEVQAENFSVDQNTGVAILSGNVLVAQGEMRMAAPKVTIIYIEGEQRIERMEAVGGVTLVSGSDAAEAERADYNVDAGKVVMRGDVLLTQGGNALTSQEMTIDLKSGTAQMGGKVKAILLQGN